MSGVGYGEDVYGVGVYGLLDMVGGDQIVLDPVEVAEGRVPLSLNSGEIRVGPEGPDWGEAALEAFQAELEVGSVPIDVRWPNRQIRIPLLLGAIGDAFEGSRANLQQKVGLFQKEGGWIKRNNLFADVVNASLVMPDRWGHRELEPDVILMLEAIPDFYGPETELPVHVQVGNPTLVFIENGIPGDMPGRVAISVTEFNNRTRRGLVWGWRSRHYSGADTAQLRYRAQDMTPLDTASVAALTGSASGQVVRHPGIGVVTTPIMGTDIVDGPLDHTGSYRVWARVHTASPLALLPDNVMVRFVWDVGDYTNPSENDWWRFPGRNNFYIADLGEIILEAAPIGEHRWAGQVQGNCRSGGRADISVDELWFVPTAEGSGVLRGSAGEATGAFVSAGLSAVGLADASEASGPLNGKSMMTGGSWATSGDTTDFTVVNDGTGAYAYRNVNTDTSDVGRLALAGTGTDDQLTNQIFFSWDPAASGPGSPTSMLVQRYSDETHFVYAMVRRDTAGGGMVYAFKRNGGALEGLGYGPLPFKIADDTQYLLRMGTDVLGAVFIWVVPSASPIGAPSLVVFDGDLAGGGGLASGRHGLREFYNAITPATITRYYSWYAAWPGLSDAVIFPNRSLQIRTDGVFRESTDATRYGPVQDVEGDLPRIPNAGLEGRPTELFLKASRGDFKSLPDNGVDNALALLKVRPSFIFPR